MKLDRALLACLLLSLPLGGCVAAPFPGLARAGSLDDGPQWRPDGAIAHGVMPGAVDGETADPAARPARDMGSPGRLDRLARTSPPATLCAVTMNLHRARKEVSLRLAAERLRTDAGIMPDFILCQEVKFSGPGRQRTSVDPIAAQLGYALRGTKRTSDSEGLAIISRYPFAHYDARQLDARTNALLLGFRRVSVMGEFAVPDLGRVRVVNVHLAYLPFEGHIRRRQLAETLRWVAERDRRAPAAVTILGGDFNARLDASMMALLRDPAAGGSLRYLEHNGARRGDSPARDRIDHLFVASATHDVRVLLDRELWDRDFFRNGMPRFWRSDHLPVVRAYAVSPSRRLAATFSRTDPAPR